MTRNESILEVDLQVFIEKVGDTKHLKYKSRIMGWQRDQLVIVSVPTLNGATVNWKTGQNCLVKFISQGNIFAFQSTLIKTIFQPLPIFFLRYPSQIENVTLRKHSRIQTFIICKVYPLKGTITLEEEQCEMEMKPDKAVMLDLSPEGALLEFSSPVVSLLTGDTILLDFTLPNGSPLRHLPAKVRNIREDDTGGKVGVQFSTKDPEQRNRIENFFKNHIN